MRDRPAIADGANQRRQTVYLRASTSRARLGLIRLRDITQLFKSLLTMLTVIFVQWHSQPRLFVGGRVPVPDCWNQVVPKSVRLVVIRLPIPVLPGGAIIDILGPGIHDFLPAQIRFKFNLRIMEGCPRDFRELLRVRVKTGDIIDILSQAFLIRFLQGD